jgi:hypothetical protein
MKKYSMILVGLLALAAVPAFAATTFNASVTSADGQLLTTLTWNSDRAACVASGHEAWTGPKPSSGSLQLPAITLSGTYSLTLSCSTPADRDATVSWVNPTTNTDGSPLTDLSGVRVYFGQGATLTEFRFVPAPATQTRFEQLADGTWRFAATALNSRNVESERSGEVSKVITGEVADAESVTLTVNPVPMAPSGLSVE